MKKIPPGLNAVWMGENIKMGKMKSAKKPPQLPFSIEMQEYSNMFFVKCEKENDTWLKLFPQPGNRYI